MAPPPSPRSGASVRPLPLDALYEVLLRVPAAKDLCRLRAVCRPWRSLLSDPHFVAAHAARHPEPLIVAAPHTDRSPSDHLLDIMDLSGRVIKRVVKPGSFWAASREWVMTAQLDVVVVVVLLGTCRSCLLLNPATGAASALPQGFAEEHSPQVQDIADYGQLVAVGKVASTGEYKVLRVLRRYFPEHHEQLCEVFTLNGSSNARWRRKKAPTDCLDPLPWKRVTIDGIVYFLSCELVAMDQGVLPIRIASFDLETEEWRPILQGPLNVILTPDSSLASLNGCLVMIHYIYMECSSVDLWFLMDFEKGLWAKQHSIQVNSGSPYDFAWPLLTLNDGRILFYNEMGLLRIYDPRTCTFTDVADIGPCYEIGLYTGSLLSLPDGAECSVMR